MKREVWKIGTKLILDKGGEKRNDLKIEFLKMVNSDFKRTYKDPFMKAFDKELKNLGGSDQLFFLKLYLEGSNIIWNEYSPVFEKRDKYKSNFYWFVKRNARYGSSSKIIYSKLYSPLKAISLTFLKFIYEFLKSFYYLILFPFSPKKNFLYFIQFLVRSVSTLLSILNIRFNEYKT